MSLWLINCDWKCSGFMASNAQVWIEWSGLESWPGALCCVLVPDTLLSQCLHHSGTFIHFGTGELNAEVTL